MRCIRKIALSERGIYEPVRNEDDVLCEVRKMLELNGALVFRAIERVPKCYRCGLWLGSSEKGTPDLSGIVRVEGQHPLAFYFEVKRDKKAVRRDAQIARIDEIKQYGGCAAFVASWAEAKAELQKHGVRLKI